MHSERSGQRTASVWLRRGVAGILLLGVFMLSFGPVPLVQAQQAGALPELGLVPPDAIGVGWVRVGDLWKGPLGKTLREKGGKLAEEFLQEMEKNLGFGVGDVDRVVGAMTLPNGPMGPPGGMAFVTMSKPIARDKVLKAFEMEGMEHKHQGKSYFTSAKSPAGSGPALAFLTDRLFVVADPASMPKVLERKPDGKIPGKLGTAVGRLLGVKPSYAIAVNPAPFLKELPRDLPPQAEPFKPLLKIEFATMAYYLGETTRAEVTLAFANADQAKEGTKAVNAAFDMLRPLAAQFFSEMPKELQEIPELGKMMKAYQAAIQDLKATHSGTDVKVVLNVDMNAAVLVGLLVPAVQKVREAANRAKSQNNLKQIALAIHGYHDTYNHFPMQAIYSKDGKPLLSWRVAILPFVEQDNLYQQFKLDEPWDSAHNKKLLDKMPTLYQHPSVAPKEPGMTHYQVFTGPQALFQGNTKVTFAKVRDGLSNTIMAAEAANPVPWTKPEDMVYDPAKPLPKLGGLFPQGQNVLFGDGSVRFLRSSIAEKVWRALITPAGGEIINQKDIE